MNATQKQMKWKRMQVQQKKKCQTEIKRKTSEQRSSNQIFLIFQAKGRPGIELILFCAT